MHILHVCVRRLSVDTCCCPGAATRSDRHAQPRQRSRGRAAPTEIARSLAVARVSSPGIPLSPLSASNSAVARRARSRCPCAPQHWRTSPLATGVGRPTIQFLSSQLSAHFSPSTSEGRKGGTGASDQSGGSVTCELWAEPTLKSEN